METASAKALWQKATLGATAQDEGPHLGLLRYKEPVPSSPLPKAVCPPSLPPSPTPAPPPLALLFSG